MTIPILYIGNKTYSSWSMRPWLTLKWGAIAFEERQIPLGGQGYGRSKIPDILAVSPSGRVPVLHVDDMIIWDSLAICEWAAEQNPTLWPQDPAARAVARSAAAEMHAGFAALRGHYSMNLRRKAEPAKQPAGENVLADIARIDALWSELRGRFGGAGACLFGQRSIADAMFAPVATRLRTYKVSAPEHVQAYCAAIFADAAFQEWERAAESETWVIEESEALYR